MQMINYDLKNCKLYAVYLNLNCIYKIMLSVSNIYTFDYYNFGM